MQDETCFHIFMESFSDEKLKINYVNTHMRDKEYHKAYISRISPIINNTRAEFDTAYYFVYVIDQNRPIGIFEKKHPEAANYNNILQVQGWMMGMRYV